MGIDRRQALAGIAAGAALVLVQRRAGAGNKAARLDYPFHLGVAAGFPTHDSAVLWTRLLLDVAAPGGAMPAQDWPVRYEIGTDAGLRRVIRRGDAVAEAAFAHSVHIQVSGLQPARDYWYRFIAAGHASPVGRLRTLPAPGARLAKLHLAVASCQHYETGHYAAWRQVAAAQPDAIVHLGDYIYEGAPVAGPRVRRHTGQLCFTLEDFRQRHALYRSDPALQAAHAAAPWFLTWDDHEVQNDYAGDTPGREEDPVQFLQRRAAAYQAWYEHLPVPPSMQPRDGRMRIHTRAALGDLATLHLLDQRQYRSPGACPQPPRLGGLRIGDDCLERLEAGRTMLGMEQERWLQQGLAAQPSRWTLLAQGTVFSHMDQGGPGAAEYWSDAWTGYPAARRRLLDDLRQARSSNPVFLSGDIHAFTVCGVNAVPEQLDSPLVAAEFSTTSISSNALPQSTFDQWRAANPHVQRLDGTRRGYLSLTLRPKRLQADLMAVDDPLQPQSEVRRMATHVVEAGDPRILPG